MIEPSWVIWGAFFPAAVALAVVFLFNLASRAGFDFAYNTGWAFGLLAGFASGWVCGIGWPTIPPRESLDWLLLAVLPAALAADSLDLSSSPRVRSASGFGWVLLSLATPVVLLQSYLRYTWTGLEGVAWAAGLGAVMLAQRASVTPFLRRRSAAFGALTYGLLAAATGIILSLSGSMVLAKLGWTLAATLTGCAFGSLISSGPKTSPTHPIGAGPLSAILFGLTLNGFFYAALDRPNAALLAACPIALGMGTLGPWKKDHWKIKAAQVLVALILLGIATARAGLSFWQSMPDPTYP
jgi:hypothetical protein